MAEKRRHLVGAQQCRMALAVKQDESPRPVQIRPLGAQTVMLHPNNPPHPIQKFLGHAEIPNEFSNIRASLYASGYRKIAPIHLGKSEDKRQNRCLSAGGNIKLASQNQRDTAKSLKRSGIKRRFALLFNKNRFRHIFHS
jgi:hypothetical protein